MDELKKIYFRYNCCIPAMPRDLREKFKNSGIDDETYEKWNEEFGCIKYKEFMNRKEPFAINEFSLFYINVFWGLPKSPKSIEMVLNMFDKVGNDFLIEFLKSSDRKCADLMSQFLTTKEDDDNFFKIKYKLDKEYRGMLPYLYDLNEMNIFNRALKLFTHLLDSIGSLRIKDLNSFLNDYKIMNL